MPRRTIVIAGILAAATPSWASEHAMKVGEVLLATSANATASQYIELEDAVMEPFANTYGLKIYDTNGAQVGSTIALTVPANTMRLLIATTTAATEFTVTADHELTVSLPNPGQACFERTAGGTGATRIHCLSWGTVATAVTGTSGGTDSGMAPGVGQSLQRSGLNYVVGTPNPGASNIPPPVTPDSPIDAAVGNDATSTPDAPGGPGATGDDGGGCCGVGGKPGSSTIVAFLVLVAMFGSRRRR